MARILLGWELGDGLGHAGLLLAAAKALEARGHECIVALSAMEATEPLWRDAGVYVIEAPRWPERRFDPSLPQPETLADIFMLAGYGNAEVFKNIGAAWEGMVVNHKPDAVIAEYAPTLALAAKGRVPVLGLGTGFSLPPKGKALSQVRFWQEDIAPQSAEAEARLLEQANRWRKTSYKHLADIFHGDASLICCLPELDPYGERRGDGERYAGRPARTVAAFAGERTGSFAYLTAEELRIREVLRALHGSGIACDAYVRQAKRFKLESEGGVTIHYTPQPLEEVLPGKAVFAHHGGLTSTDMALRTGVPQLLLARNLEQLVTGRLVEKAGLGKCVPLKIAEKSTIPEMVKHVSKLAKSSAVRERCAAKANELTERKYDTAGAIAEAVEVLLR